MARRTRNYWNSIDNIRFELRKYIERYGSNEVTYTCLRKHGYDNFINGIKRYGINLDQLCIDLDIPIIFTPKNYYKDINNVITEILELVNIYGCIPPVEVFTYEKKHQLYQCIYKFHGGISKIRDIIGEEKNSLSKLEISTKKILDELIEDGDFIDNKSKSLLKFGVNMQNPKSKAWLELDRYYYNARVAIEINGLQHYRASSSGFYTEDRVKYIKKLDILKQELLSKQNISLIIIPYNRTSKNHVLSILNQCGVLKLRELLETPSGTISSQA